MCIYIYIYYIYMYNFIVSYICHRAARHAGACSRQCLVVPCLMACFLYLKGTPPPYSLNLHTPFFTLFASCFQTSLFTIINAKRSQKRNFKISQNRKNTKTLVVRAHLRTRYAKRPRLEGAKPLKITTVSQFWLFF